MSDIQMNPDCKDGKHQSCSGTGWDLDLDVGTQCPCPCHAAEHGGLVIKPFTDNMRLAIRNAVVWP